MAGTNCYIPDFHFVHLEISEITLKNAAVLLVLSLAIAACTIRTVEAQTEYSINLAGATWDHTDIRILLIPRDGESWWDPTVINLTLQAIDMWNSAFATFASEYPNFSYVSNIRLEATVSAEATENFDVYIMWTEFLRGDNFEATVGLTQLYTRAGVIEKGNITLAVKDALGIPLTSSVKQSVVAHEIGHALGLHHTEQASDIMYAQISFEISVRPISTLNVYGVAQVFRWRSVSPHFNPSNQGSELSSVSLPSGIEYEYLNVPPQYRLSEIISSFLRWIQTPEGLNSFITLSIVIIGIVIISSALYRFRRERRQQKSSC